MIRKNSHRPHTQAEHLHYKYMEKTIKININSITFDFRAVDFVVKLMLKINVNKILEA